jgi:chromosome segregation ATPase
MCPPEAHALKRLLDQVATLTTSLASLERDIQALHAMAAAERDEWRRDLQQMERERDAGEQNYQFLAATLKEQIAECDRLRDLVRERDNDSWDHAESRDALLLRAEAAERERDEWRGRFETVDEERRGLLAVVDEPHPMLLQAMANLQALQAELRNDLCIEDCTYVSLDTVQCWYDKLGTAIADLQEVRP